MDRILYIYFSRLSYSLILDLYVLFLIIQNQSLDDTLRALHNSYFLKEDVLFFSSLRGVGPMGRRPRLPGWSFQQCIYGGVLPPPHCPNILGPAVSPIDTSRKDSALPPVTSEKSTLFIGVTKIVRFCKALISMPYFFGFP